MSAIYLKHEIHGTKVAICEMEATFDKSNGWVAFDPYAVEDAVEEVEPVMEEKPLEPILEPIKEPIKNTLSLKKK